MAAMRALAVLAAVLAAPAAADEALVVTAANETLAAREIELARKGADLELRLVDAGGKARVLNMADVVEVAFGTRPPGGARPLPEDVEIVLTTGDLVCGKAGARHEDGIQLVSPGLGNPLVPYSRIRSVVFPANRAFLPRKPPAKADTADLVFTTTGDRAEGSLLWISNAGIAYQSKRLGDATLPLAQVAGVWLIETEAPPKEPAGLLVTVLGHDGTSLRAEVDSLKDGVLAFKDLYGQDRKLARSAVSALHVKNGRVVYLSDLEPKSVDEDANYIRGPKKLPSDLEYPYQRDRSARGTRLLLGGVEHRKGLGVRARSELVYALDGAFQRFQATVGLDAASNGLGAVAVEILLDGRKVQEAMFRGNDAPRAVDVKVDGGRELKLLATWAGHGQSDFVDWGSARLIR
jgi:hypothetical protein